MPKSVQAPLTLETDVYLRNAWYSAGWAHDYPAEPTAVTLLDERVVIYRGEDGAPVAMEDRCPHRLAPLSLGRCEGSNIRCMYHGLLFAPDGRCVKIPGQPVIPEAVRVKVYPVVERWGVIWIWMGAPHLQDETLIPEFQGPHHPDWSMIPGHMDYEANYELINDNLLDLSHLAWVHAASFGGGSAESNESWADIPAKISVIDRGVRVDRWGVDLPLPPYMQTFAGERGDMFNTYDFLVPGIFLLKTLIYPAGTAGSLSEGQLPAARPLHQSFTCQAVTPLTKDRSRYIFGFGPEAGKPELAQVFHDMAIMAFTEDKVMIEAQQKVINSDPERRMLPLVMDGAPRRYAGVVAKLAKIEAEQNA